MKVFCQLLCSVVLLLLPRSSVFDQHHHHHHSMQRSAAIRIWGRATMAYGFPSNVVSVRLQQQQQQRLLEHSMRWMNRGNNVGRQLFTAAMCPQYRIPQTRVSGTSLYFYNQRHQRQNREMSKITEARNIERMKKKRQQQKDGTDKNKKKEPYEWLPFWTTPERDPYDSIYIQDPIEEEDCDLLRLYIPTEDDMLEIGTMCAMLFFTTPNLETYESMPNNGDVIFLKGDLGTGKSVFARGFVRGALGDWEIDVPSPTYLLSNTYFASETKGSNKNIEYVHCYLALFYVFYLTIDLIHFTFLTGSIIWIYIGYKNMPINSTLC